MYASRRFTIWSIFLTLYSAQALFVALVLTLAAGQ